MRSSARTLNRAWLAILGICLMVLSALGLLIAAGLLPRLARSAGLAVNGPQANSAALPTHAIGQFNTTLDAVLLTVIGIVVTLLGLSWIIAQIPRRNEAKRIRLHDDPSLGLTSCEPAVIDRAVAEDVEALPGVTQASAIFRGTASHPELIIKLTANERADLAVIFNSIHTTVADNLASSLETPLQRLAVQLDITRNRRRNTSATI